MTWMGPDDAAVPGEEIAPGVILERRQFLSGLVGAAALSCLGLWPRQALAQGPDAIEAAEAVRRLEPLAQRLLEAEDPDEEEYLAEVATLLASIDPPAGALPRRRWRMDRLGGGRPVVLYHMRLAPGAIIPLHDHRAYNGVLLGLEGEVGCRNFEIVLPEGSELDLAAGEVPAKGSEFLIRQTQESVLEAGSVSSLARVRDNLHVCEAGREGARLLDLFTYFSDEAGSHNVRWDTTPVDPERGLYRAEWA